MVLKFILTILALIGLGVAGYLTYFALNPDIGIFCFSAESASSCEIVNTSSYAEIFGNPVALLGMVFYALVLILVLIEKKKWLQLWLGWGIIFSLYLTFVEIFIIQAICWWCLASFLIIGVMFILTLFWSPHQKTLQNQE